MNPPVPLSPDVTPADRHSSPWSRRISRGTPRWALHPSSWGSHWTSPRTWWAGRPSPWSTSRACSPGGVSPSWQRARAPPSLLAASGRSPSPAAHLRLGSAASAAVAASRRSLLSPRTRLGWYSLRLKRGSGSARAQGAHGLRGWRGMKYPPSVSRLRTVFLVFNASLRLSKISLTC